MQAFSNLLLVGNCFAKERKTPGQSHARKAGHASFPQGRIRGTFETPAHLRGNATHNVFTTLRQALPTKLIKALAFQSALRDEDGIHDRDAAVTNSLAGSVPSCRLIFSPMVRFEEVRKPRVLAEDQGNNEPAWQLVMCNPILEVLIMFSFCPIIVLLTWRCIGRIICSSY